MPIWHLTDILSNGRVAVPPEALHRVTHLHMDCDQVSDHRFAFVGVIAEKPKNHA